MTVIGVAILILLEIGFVRSHGDESDLSSAVLAAAKAHGCAEPMIGTAVQGKLFSDATLLFGCRLKPAEEKELLRVGRYQLIVSDPKNPCPAVIDVKGMKAIHILPFRPTDIDRQLKHFTVGPRETRYRGPDQDQFVKEALIQVCLIEDCSMVQYFLCHKKQWLLMGGA